jgi:lysophospholipase L1-like esterase
MVYSLIPTIFLLAAGELGLRTWAHYFRTPYERFNNSKGRLELVPNTRFTTPRGDDFIINSKGFLGPEFQAYKPSGTYRIFALGDSCTFGSGNWKEAYPAILGELLNSSGYQHRFEIINAGIEGYNSEYALARLKEEVVQYEPDMVLLYIGWNDLMKVNPSNLSATGKYTWLTKLMDRSYILKAYNKLLFYYLRPIFLKPEVKPSEVDLHAFDQFTPLAFQNNLESIVSLLIQRRTTPVLMTLPTVLTNSMTQEDVKSQHVFFPYYAGTYSVSKVLSLHRAYNDTIRGVAALYKVPLVDLDALFNVRAKRDLFWDTMHPSEKGHRLIAEVLAERIRQISMDRSWTNPLALRS